MGFKGESKMNEANLMNELKIKVAKLEEALGKVRDTITHDANGYVAYDIIEAALSSPDAEKWLEEVRREAKIEALSAVGCLCGASSSEDHDNYCPMAHAALAGGRG
jgi:hypothetical protein